MQLKAKAAEAKRGPAPRMPTGGDEEAPGRPDSRRNPEGDLPYLEVVFQGGPLPRNLIAHGSVVQQQCHHLGRAEEEESPGRLCTRAEGRPAVAAEGLQEMLAHLRAASHRRHLADFQPVRPGSSAKWAQVKASWGWAQALA